MNIKQTIFNYLAARRPMREVTYPNFKKVGTILLLYESEWMERNPEIRAMVAQLHDMDKQVIAWGYLKKDKIQSPILPDSRILGPKDYTLLGKPKDEVLQYLEHHPVDMLIDLSTSPLLPLQYIALYAQARFKIGAHTSGLYDMVVQASASATADYLFQQVLHYLTTIKSAD